MWSSGLAWSFSDCGGRNKKRWLEDGKEEHKIKEREKMTSVYHNDVGRFVKRKTKLPALKKECEADSKRAIKLLDLATKSTQKRRTKQTKKKINKIRRLRYDRKCVKP
jgi:hypothetical protein